MSLFSCWLEHLWGPCRIDGPEWQDRTKLRYLQSLCATNSHCERTQRCEGTRQKDVYRWPTGVCRVVFSRLFSSWSLSDSLTGSVTDLDWNLATVGRNKSDEGENATFSSVFTILLTLFAPFSLVWTSCWERTNMKLWHLSISDTLWLDWWVQIWGNTFIVPLNEKVYRRPEMFIVKRKYLDILSRIITYIKLNTLKTCFS